jgi:hypothetical protein
VVGSLITLVNDARLAAGKGPVGFINPSVRVSIVLCWAMPKADFFLHVDL